MWLLLAAGLLQGLLFFERILYRLLLPVVVTFFVQDQRSSVKQFADNSVVSSVGATIIYYAGIPLNFVISLVGALWQNATLFASILFFTGVLLLMSDNFQRTMLYFVDTYNSGIGQTLDLFFMAGEIAEFFLRLVLPLYNAIVWFNTQFITQVLIPLFSMVDVVTQLPDAFSNISLCLSSLVLSLRTYLQNFLFCASGNDQAGSEMYGFRHGNYTQNIPHTAPNLQCAVNQAYYTIDLMTPGSYMQQVVVNIQGLVYATCSPAGLLIELLIYPLSDFNFYKALHCAVNFGTFTVFGMPMMTYKRCKYAEDNGDVFSKEVQAIMCTPDWKPWISILVEAQKSMGKLFDNWLDVSLAMVERVQGVNQDLCTRTQNVDMVIQSASELLLAPVSLMRHVMLTDNMYAVTDGISTLYHTMTDRSVSEIAIGNWPFPVNTDWGLAAVKVAETGDADIQADARTGMLGCQCVDEVIPGLEASGHTRLRVICASVPYVVFDDNETAYNTTTVQEIVFVNDHVRTLMTCENTMIRVHTLRFSRKRVADGFKGTGPINDLFDSMNLYGSQQPVSFSADAAIYIQPRCSDNSLSACSPGMDTCFPFCLGLHLSGQSESNITAYNAQRWDEYVTVTQTDCVGYEDYTSRQKCQEKGFGNNLLKYDVFSIFEKPVCDIVSCIEDDRSTTLMEIAKLNSTEIILQNKTTDEYQAWVRLDTQPFAVAGDVMLRIVEDKLRITRLHDTNNGQYTMQHERLNLLHQESVGVLDEEAVCATNGDDSCYNDAMRDNQIVLPQSYFSNNNVTYVHSVASEWAVHWAVNPENSVYESKIQRCKGINMEGPAVTTSYSKPRVWTVKSMRVTDLEQNVEHTDKDVSFMVIPEWFDGENPDCDAIVGMRIAALEYVNDENILITVLKTSPRNWNVDGSNPIDFNKVQYDHYYLHPTKNDCYDTQDLDNGIYSCFQHIKMGMFNTAFVPKSTQLFGTFCPAMRRMPQLGSVVAEMLMSVSHLVKVALDAVSILPVAYIDTIFDQSRTTPTFHSTLNGEFLNLNPFLDSYQRTAMHISNTLPRLGKFFEGSNNAVYKNLQPRLIGTAKVMQHMRATVPLTGGLLMQLKGVQDLPIKDTLWQAYSSLRTTRASIVMEKIRGSIVSMAGTLRLNMKLMREAMKQGLLASARSARKSAPSSLSGGAVGKTKAILSASSLVTTTLFESQRDVRRHLLDPIRVQCHGLGEIVGRNSMGNALRETCLMVPEAFEGILRVLLVLGIDYPLMDCVCKQTQEADQTDVIVESCLEQLYPLIGRVFMFEYLQSSVTAFGENKCFVYMDQANSRLMTAFEPLQNRMFQASDVLGTALDSLLTFIPGYDAGQCFDYDTSPYVMAIVPEPVDYFMSCMHTYDCRAKCTDEIRSFEEALAAVGTPPVFSDELQFMVDSRFFSDLDVEEGRDQLPFPAYGMQELSPASCQQICEQGNIRCILLMGIDHVNVTAAYYCLPKNFMESVYRQYPPLLNSYAYFNEWGKNDKVVNIHALTTKNALKNRLEVLLVSIMDIDTSLYSIWIYIETGERYRILETRDFEPDEPGNDITDVTSDLFYFQSISNIRVVSDPSDKHADVYFVGVHDTILDDTVLDYDTRESCMKKTIYFEQEDIDFEQRIETTDCTSDVERVISSSNKIVDLHPPSASPHQVWLPLEVTSTPRIILCNMTELSNQCTPEEGQRFDMKSTMYNFVKLVGLDPTVPVITTDENVALINRKFISDVSEAAFSTDSTIVKINLLLVGSLSNTRSWIHSVKLSLDTSSNEYVADVRASEEVEQTMELQSECSIDNCVGCQTKEQNKKYNDLQMKCYAAAECSIARCVGTLVNMRKPLCNIGKVMMTLPLDISRISFGFLWKSIATQIITIVELTKQRRNVYVFSAGQESFTALTCQTKDEIVASSAVFTSVVGALTSTLSSFGSHDLSPTSHLIDSNTNAQVVLGMAAMTKFLSSLGMAPLYAAIITNKILGCNRDLTMSIFSNMASLSGINIKLSMRKEAITEASDSAVGMCLTDFGRETMRDISDKSASERVQTLMQQILSDVAWFLPLQRFSPYWHSIDGFLSYIYGVVTALLDVVQVIDWKNCKLPVVSFFRADKCACKDQQVRIPASRKTSKIDDLLTATESLWCSGPMLLTTSDNKDFLIWNPYSLHQLLHPNEVSGGSGDFETYVECITSVKAESCQEPTLPLLEQQDVNVLQVITRCRSNYQQKRWDSGAILFGLYDLDVWRTPKDSINFNLLQLELLSTANTFLFRFMYLSQFMENNPSIMDSTTHSCLSAALSMEVTEHTCADSFYKNSDKYDSVNEYFQYEHTPMATFVDRDACQVYSGDLQQRETGAKLPMILWRGSSSNKVPLAKMHYIDWSAETDRETKANQDIDELLREIEVYFETKPFSLEQANEVELSHTSWEGDSLHQFVDCVMLGPYAAADLQSSFTMPNGKRVPVPQYHRGNAASRAFSSEMTTGGSEARQNIITGALSHVQDAMQDSIPDIMKQTYAEIRAKYRDRNNMLCICRDLTQSIKCCSEAKHERDIRFALIGEQKKIYNIEEELTETAFTSLIGSSKIQEEIWADPTRTFHTTYSFTDEELEEMASKYVFNTEQRVARYSKDEVLQQITEHTLWQRCMGLLSTAFFTLPLKTPDVLEREGKSPGDAYVDANTFYDPINPPEASRGAYLHGMEHAIADILAQAREKSPVFWTHVHRYIATDSVWCEDSEIELKETPESIDLHETFHNTIVSMTGLRGAAHAGKVHYPAKLACFCGWSDGTHCLIPQSVQNYTQDTELQGMSTYTSREDFFVLAEALQGVYIEDCSDYEPNVVWGLLDSELHKDWFSGTDTADKISLQEVATYGPSGIRLGMLKDEGVDALKTHAKRFAWNEKASQNQTYNWDYKHTVGQPVCESTKDQVFNKTDLTTYLKDTLFPMAHSVFEAPAAAYCSTWVIEYALWHILHYVLGEGDEETLIQLEREKIWKERCDIQLQQLGICNLRGVFDMQPNSALDADGNLFKPEHCAFTLADDNTCSYVTENCLVMCDNQLYDPCLCANESTCEGYEFEYPSPSDSCGRILDPRKFAMNEEVLLYSMHWPASMPQDEVGNGDDTELKKLNNLLTEINSQRAEFTFESEQLHKDIANLVVDHDAHKDEGDVDFFCTDLFDYFEGGEQHPIGYHPTRAFDITHTNLRGFDSWMTKDDSGWIVDPVRLRNMTAYSQTFGASHVVCDYSAYGAKGHNLNPYTLKTRWNSNAKVDMAVPLELTPDLVETMQTFGESSEDSTDTPCQTSQPNVMLQHSVGLVRAWFRLYGEDKEIQEAYDKLWPHTQAQEELCTYALEDTDPLSHCRHPKLHTCFDHGDCNSLSSTNSIFKCLKADEETGICVPENSCFRHKHCQDDKMCSGEGECVTPRIYFENNANDEHKINFQMFSRDATSQCKETMYGISEHQQIQDFAPSHGLCSLRNWYVYQNLSSSPYSSSDRDYIKRLNDLEYARPEEETQLSAREHELLKMTPHPCDRDYQHTSYHYCKPNENEIYEGFTQTARTKNAYLGMRTWLPAANNTGVGIRMCDLGSYTQSLSLLHPYQKDTFRNVPTDIKKCTHFQVCENFQFQVGHETVSRRRKLPVLYQEKDGNIEIEVSSVSERYTNNDADNCFGMGHLVQNNRELSICLVDRLVTPLLSILYGKRDIIGEQALMDFDSTQQEARYNIIRDHCPHAFTQTENSLTDLKLYQYFLEVLTARYTPEKRKNVAFYTNTILLSLFGLHTNLETNRGFDSIEGYLKHSACARFISSELNAFKSAMEDLQIDIYTEDGMASEKTPGDSIYIFHERAPMSLHLPWFWRCVVITPPGEGGAPWDWFQRMTDPEYSLTGADLPCQVHEFNINDPPDNMTVKQLLQKSGNMFMTSEVDATIDLTKTAEDLADAVQYVVSNGLNFIGLRQSPKINCINENESQECQNTVLLFQSEDCWTKSCYENQCNDLGFNATYNLYSEVFDLVFGSRDMIEITSTNLQTLESNGHIRFEITLDENVNKRATFIPYISFPEVDTFLNTFLPDGFTEDETVEYDEIYEQYASKSGDENCRIQLNVPEFELLHDNYEDFPASDYKYVSFKRAKYEMMKYFSREIYSKDVLPPNENIHTTFTPTEELFTTTSYSHLELDSNYQENYLHRAFEYNQFMRAKTYACADNNDINVNLETNLLPRRIRSCIDSMKEEIGWEVPHGETVGVGVHKSTFTGGFYPTFSQEHTTPKFVDDMFNKNIIDKTSLVRSMCFEQNDEVRIINPLWAGDYDVTSCPLGLGCGCDTHMGELRFVDVRCAIKPGQECKDSFPVFDDMLQNKIPMHCLSRGESQQPVVMVQDGSMWADEVALCRRDMESESYTNGCRALDNTLFGGLNGWKGETVGDLHVNSQVPEIYVPGLYSTSNSIFRRTKFTPSTLPVLQVLDSDIGGHAFHFKLQRNSFESDELHLECVLLATTPERKKSQTQKNWLQNLESKWKWQHDRLQEAWPEVPQDPSKRPSWKCPLQWISAYSDSSKTFAARVPNAYRNRVRFKHITGEHAFAHPTVQSISKMQKLLPAYYKADHIMVAIDKESFHTHGQLDEVIGNLYNPTWTQVEIEQDDTACEQILDWPSQTYRLRDDTQPTTKDNDRCFVLDRLPKFAIKVENQTDLNTKAKIKENEGFSPAMQASGVCHMGRLHHLYTQDEENYENLQLQMCKEQQGDTGTKILCVFTNTTDTNDVQVVYKTFYKNTLWTESMQANNKTLYMKRQCGKIPPFNSQIKDRNLKSHSLNSENIDRSQLSVGAPTRLSTERVLAAYLRRKICPEANETVCERLTGLFETSMWKKGRFLPIILNKTKYDQLFMEYDDSRLPFGFNSSEGPGVNSDDIELWSRPWVFCDLSKTDNQGCKNSISRTEWVNHTTRFSQCQSKIQEATSEMDLKSTVNFCQLTAQTEDVCKQMIAWNVNIQSILCRASGLCSDVNFFYNPAMYAIDNQAFVSASVQEFYTSIDGDACTQELTDDQQTQEESNKQAKLKCASVNMEILRFIIRYWRQQAITIFKIGYYFIMMMIQVVQVAIAGAIEGAGGNQLLGEAVTKLGRYFRLFIEHIGSMVRYLIDSIWKLLVGQEGTFGKALRDLVKTICEIIAIIKHILCVITSHIHHFVENLLSFLKAFLFLKVPFKLGPIDTSIQPFTPLLVLPQTLYFLGTTTLLNYTLAHSKNELCKPMSCDNLGFEGAENSFSGTLPVATRCWSSYTTFFGDSQGLACTAADTCVLSHTDLNSRKVCATCTETSSSLVSQFGCDPVLKMCICGVVKHERTYCRSNAECRDPAATCAYIDTDLEPSFSNVECTSCQTNRVCYFNNDEDETGFCACPLFKTSFSRCPAEKRGQLISPTPDAFCLYEPDPKYASSVTYSSSFDNTLTVPCYTLDITQTYCTSIVDVKGNNPHFVLGIGTSNMRRRLLQAAEEPGVIVTKNPTCQDALEFDVPFLHNTRMACIEAFKSSSETVLMLNNSLLPCTFCSPEDLLHAIRFQTIELTSMFQSPRHTLLVLFRHGPGKHVYEVFKSAVKAGRLILQDMHDIHVQDKRGDRTRKRNNTIVVDLDIDPKDLLFPIETLHTGEAIPILYNITNSTNLDFLTEFENKTNGTRGRQLLSIAQIIDTARSRLEQMVDRHVDYSTQLAITFDYEYANKFTDNTRLGWFAQWPPQYATNDDASVCGPFWNTLGILEQAMGNASLAYSIEGLKMKGSPATYIHQAWPRVANVTNSNTWSHNNTNRLQQKHEGVVGSWVWLAERVFSALKLTTDTFYDLLFASTQEFSSIFQCNYEAVQTCSTWRINLFHSTIISMVYFSVWFLVARSLHVHFVASISVFVFTPVILYLSYQYSPICAPMIPTCFFEDLLLSLRLVFPKFMRVPSIFIYNKQTQEGIPCKEYIETASNNIWISPTHTNTKISCIKSCAEPPLDFTSWRAVFAWLVVEFGQGAVNWVSEFHPHIPLLDHSDMQMQLDLKNYVWKANDADMLLSHRICALTQSYQLLPFMVLIFAFLLTLRPLANVVATAAIPLLNTLTAMLNSVFVKSEEDMEEAS